MLGFWMKVDNSYIETGSDKTKVGSMDATTVLYVSGFLDLFGVSMVVTQIGMHVRELGASSTTAGFVGSVYGALQLFSSPTMGRWSDVRGRRFCVILCLLMSGTGYLCMGFSSTLLILVFSRVLPGLFKQSQSLSRSMLADLTPPDRRCHVYGRFNSMSSVGFILGPLVSSTIVQHEGGLYRASFLCGTVFILNAVFLWCFLPERSSTKHNDLQTEGSQDGLQRRPIHSEKPQLQLNSLTSFFVSFRSLNWEGLWDLFLINFLSGFSVMMYRSNSDLILHDRFGTTKQHMSYLTSYSGVVAALCGLVSGWIASHYGDNYRLYKHMLFSLFMTLVALTLVTNFWVYVLVLAVLSFVTTNLRVASASLLVHRGGAERVGAVVGLGDTVLAIPRMLSPLLSGMALEVSDAGPSLVGSMMAGMAVLLTLRPQGKLKKS